MSAHVHHWHHEGCHHGPAVGETECFCGESEPGYYCCGTDDGTECDAKPAVGEIT